MRIRVGVNKFNGPMLGATWYGWAALEDGTDLNDPKQYREGTPRVFKWRARLDARRLARELR